MQMSRMHRAKWATFMLERFVRGHLVRKQHGGKLAEIRARRRAEEESRRAKEAAEKKAKDKEERGKGSGTTGDAAGDAGDGTPRPKPSKRWKMLVLSNFRRHSQPYSNNCHWIGKYDVVLQPAVDIRGLMPGHSGGKGFKVRR